MSIILCTVYTLVCLILIGGGIAVWRRTRRIGTFFIILVTLGVGYDNLILSLGNILGAGPLLLGLSLPRFVLHQLVLPWIIYTGFEQAKVAGHKWANRPTAGWLVLTFIILVTLLGAVTRLVVLELVPEVMDGLTRYVAEVPSGHLWSAC
jgi:hypothetical protein